MVTDSKNPNRLAYRLLWLFMLGVLGFWGWELKQSMDELDRRQEKTLADHQQALLVNKGEEFRDLFHAIYQSARTISLLPMVREVSGANRHDEKEDIVAQGRLSLDAHRTLQQIYTNLASNINVSEVYYVLDGFQPNRDVPFFMYDNLIAGISQTAESDSAAADVPLQVEDFEYNHFPQQLEWFRENAPAFRWSNVLNDIPVRLSPLLRTCDNTQYHSTSRGEVRDAMGFIYAMPVYAADTSSFKGMIAIILRANILEASLIGIPYLPLTPTELAQQKREGWQTPAPVSFQLEQPEYGILIRDRRYLFSSAENKAPQPGSRKATRTLDLGTYQPWTLSHTLSPDEIAKLNAPITQERHWGLIGRISLLIIMAGITLWAALMLRRSQRELHFMANMDGLTALPNRRFFFEHLQRAINRSQRSRNKVVLFFLDITDFKAINDAYGHHGGDALLVSIAQRLQDSLRTTDTLDRLLPDSLAQQVSASRLGGDEFIIICEDWHSTDDIPAMAERLMNTLQKPFLIEGNEVKITASMGVAVYPDDAADSNKLLHCADVAMHESRQQDGSYVIFNEALRARSERQNILSAALKTAMELQQFELHYQPKASLRDGHIVSAEALLRWKHPELGNISPAEFIPILERKGDIIEVGAWVVEQACHDLARLDKAGFPQIQVSVNVSVRQLRTPNLHQTIGDILTRTSTAPQRLILEITESMVMENFEEGRQALLRLHALGTPLAIDDFGTGYSSLTYLQHLPLDYLKLDKGFIDGMDNPRVKHIVETVILLARGLSLQTIAEGIETADQRDTLAALGCDMMQGYLLSRPIPLDELIGWMQARAKPQIN